MALRLLREAALAQKAQGHCVTAIIGVAGTTDSGTIDDLDGLADVAAEIGAHFHVDAAWGGPLLFSEKYRGLLRGIERADSVTIDGHKQLYLPMGIGTVLIRDPKKAEVIEKQSPYIIRAGSPDLGRRALEGSRPGMALYLHAALHVLGREGYEYLVEEGVRKAELMSQAIAKRPEFELLTEPQMNIVNYRALPESLRGRVRQGALLEQADNELVNRFNVKLQETQRSLGRTFVSRTTLQFTKYGRTAGIVALRAVLANPLTTLPDVEVMLDEQVSIANDLKVE
jgi:glutamate decarboxylase